MFFSIVVDWPWVFASVDRITPLASQLFSIYQKYNNEFAFLFLIIMSYYQTYCICKTLRTLIIYCGALIELVSHLQFSEG